MFAPRNHKKYAVRFSYCVFLLVALLTTSCQETTSTPFIPPTALGNAATQATIVPFVSPTAIVVTIAQTPPPDFSPTPLPSTATPPCINSLKYLSDLTVPDGTTVKPGDSIDKQWSVENDGSCNWDTRYRLKLIDGDALGANTDQTLYPARAGTQAILEIAFTAPQQAGTYKTAWQAFDPDGQPFGDAVYMQVVVSP